MIRRSRFGAAFWTSNAFLISIFPNSGTRLSAAVLSPSADGTGDVQLLRPCQRDCLDACAKGNRVIEMACGTGKTRVIQELVLNVSGRAPWAFDSIRFLLVVSIILDFWPFDIVVPCHPW